MRSVARAALYLTAAVLASGCPADLGKCGNGTLDPGEQCDDGNQLSGDGCSRTCQRSGLDEDDDGVLTPEDCNDRLASTHPGAPELPCDGVDNDCDEATPDCPNGPDAGRDAAVPARDAEVPDPPDAEVPEPDACVALPETCADCVDSDCDGVDEACDPVATLAVDPIDPAPGGDAQVAVSAEVGYAWVLLFHTAPDGTTTYQTCTDCWTSNDVRFTWWYTLSDLAPGRHVVRFEYDHVDDNPEGGARVICRAFDVGP